jgi:maleylacetate reductase
MRTFTYISRGCRVVFGSGTIAAVGQEVPRLGASRVLMVTGSDPKDRAAAVADALGSLVVARFAGAAKITGS